MFYVQQSNKPTVYIFMVLYTMSELYYFWREERVWGEALLSVSFSQEIGLTKCVCFFVSVTVFLLNELSVCA